MLATTNQYRARQWLSDSRLALSSNSSASFTWPDCNAMHPSKSSCSDLGLPPTTDSAPRQSCPDPPLFPPKHPAPPPLPSDRTAARHLAAIATLAPKPSSQVTTGLTNWYADGCKRLGATNEEGTVGMRILVVGGGGREHALIWKLRESPRVEKLWCAPGNGGIAAEAECLPVDAGDVNGLVALAERIQPDLTVVGPEIALANGLTDAFRARNWPIVGPSQQAAQLEASKVFSKEFLLRHKIPTANMYGVFDSAPEALRALDQVPWPLVIKADGLCAGKGVCLVANAAEAKDFIEGALL